MIAIADTSPISALVRIGRVAMLTGLFDQVLIPPEVAAELDEGKPLLGDWRSAAGASTIATRAVGAQLLLRQLAGLLHRGEAAAIALAAETPGAVLVIDDSDGRDAARRLDLRVTGTLGLIVEAKRRALIPGAAARSFAPGRASGLPTTSCNTHSNLRASVEPMRARVRRTHWHPVFMCRRSLLVRPRS